MAIKHVGAGTNNSEFNNVGNVKSVTGQTDAEFKTFDRARSSDAHIVLDFTGKIIPIGYFEKFDASSKSEIIYRHPIGSKVPIGESKPGGWDLNFSNGLVDNTMWGMIDTYYKDKFEGNATQRLQVAQRIKFTNTVTDATGATSNEALYFYWETTLAGYKISDPGNGDPLEESCTGYARFRTIAPKSA